MFYRWREPGSILMMTDMANAYLGEDLFLLGGHPSLMEVGVEQLDSPGIMTMALNNVPYVFGNPTFWLTADRPTCYGSHFYHRPDIIKLAKIEVSRESVPDTDRPIKSLPSMYFYEINATKYDNGNFLTEGTDFAWWNSVFPISIQMAWRLGFRRIFFVGCAFWTNTRKPYAWPVRITEEQKTTNQLVYNSDIDRLSGLLPHIEASGLQLFSCTPNSRLNELMTFIPLSEAISESLKWMPPPTPLGRVYHSTQT